MVAVNKIYWFLNPSFLFLISTSFFHCIENSSLCQHIITINLDNSTLYFFETTLLKFIETCYFKDWLIENNLNFEKTEEYIKLIKEFLTTIKTLDFDKNNLHESIYKNLTNKFLDFIIEKQNLKKPFFIDPLVLFAIVFVISIKLNQ